MSTIIFTLLFFIVGIILLSNKIKIQQSPIAPRIFGLISIAISIVIIMEGTFIVVPAGEVGVQILFGNVEKNVLQNGFHIINPLYSIEKMNIRTQNYTMSSRKDEGNVSGNDAVSITMKDQSSPQMDLSVTFHLSPSQANAVFQNIGLDYLEKIIRPDIRSVVPRVATLFNSTDLYDNEKRTLFENICKQQLDSIFHLRGVVLEDVKLREVVPSEEVQKAINLKITAQQDALAMEFQEQKAVKQAEIQKIQAHGIDSSQAIIAHSLTNQYLQYKYFETLEKIGDNGNMVVVAPANGQIPIINLPTTKTK